MLLTQPALGRRGHAATLEPLRYDRQLEETLAHGGDPLHLAAVFGIDAKTTIRYATTARQLPESAAEHHDASGSPRTRGRIRICWIKLRGDHAADMLAAFLKALHVEAPADAPDASDFGAHPKECAGGFEYFLQAVDLGGFAENDIRAVWDDAMATPEWPGPRVWVHGDLHPANVVVADGTLADIVDFDALIAGDPAGDLGATWLLLPAGGASKFFDSYAQADEAKIRRARGLAAMKCLFLMLRAKRGPWSAMRQAELGPAGRSALDRVPKGLRQTRRLRDHGANHSGTAAR
ncbi:phosphotransferase [Salinispora mooreana]|uniref:phosphotransferase n=1 Tax=Salinispora mooreana TaxID=999545 RepID=UPI0003A20965|nr:phosphotransferase [Salinispora mooreana]